MPSQHTTHSLTMLPGEVDKRCSLFEGVTFLVGGFSERGVDCSRFACLMLDFQLGCRRVQKIEAGVGSFSAFFRSVKSILRTYPELRRVAGPQKEGDILVVGAHLHVVGVGRYWHATPPRVSWSTSIQGNYSTYRLMP